MLGIEFGIASFVPVALVLRNLWMKEKVGWGITFLSTVMRKCFSSCPSVVQTAVLQFCGSGDLG